MTDREINRCNKPDKPMVWKLRTRTLRLDAPVFMGIVNVTPDSFSDGGRFLEPQAAVDHAWRLIADGAGILDIGGESTRPGSEGISAREELRRILPVLQKLGDQRITVPVSVDTVKAETAGEVIAAGAEIINDVSGLADAAMLPVLLRTGAAYGLMHTQGIPKTMQDNPQYGHVVREVFDFLRAKRNLMIAAGIEPEKIAVDPGLGFGKTFEHNWQLVENIGVFLELDAPLLAGHSRKRFLSARYADRDAGTRMVSRQLIQSGVHILRLHEIER
ncbi:MAG: dihydropteroate synthase [Planctomycetaceae bacterium]|jgi:dihydropteroate synthase|nr:dihydropteroate synthase [Planctomycetaceae bacterium]